VDAQIVRDFFHRLRQYYNLRLHTAGALGDSVGSTAEMLGPAIAFLEAQLQEARRELQKVKHVDSYIFTVQSRLIRMVKQLQRELKECKARRVRESSGTLSVGTTASSSACTASAVETEGGEASDDEDSSTALCIVCLELNACIVAVPCGHRCLCLEHRDCLKSHTRCPICRASMSLTIRVY
jgi:hypothetical protein